MAVKRFRLHCVKCGRRNKVFANFNLIEEGLNCVVCGAAYKITEYE